MFTVGAQAQDGAGAILGDDQAGLSLPRPTGPTPATAETIVLPTPRPGAPTLLVRALDFGGDTALLRDADRAALRAAAIGRRLDFEGLRALADAATARMQAQGLMLARAVLPTQDVTEGHVAIELREGRLAGTAIARAGTVRLGAGIAEAVLRHHVPGPTIERGALERALLLLNDMPALSARARLRAGSEAETAELVVDLDQGPVFSSVFALNNHAAVRTGAWVAGILLRLDDPTGRGERIDLDITASRGTRMLRLGAGVPLGPAGTRLQGGISVMEYRNVDALGVAAGLRGSARNLTLGLDHPLVRSRARDLRLGLILDHARLRDDSAAGTVADKSVASATILADGRWRHARGGETVARAALSLGRLDLSRIPAALAADAAGARTHGRFAKIAVSAGHVAPLAPGLALTFGASAQAASRNLDTSEKFVLGGPRGVRGWPVGEGRGDAGLLLSTELRWQPTGWRGPGRVEAAALGDWGRIRLNRRPAGLAIPTASGANTYSLASAGVALRWLGESGSVELILARGLGPNPGRSPVDGSNADGGFGRSRLWVSGTMRF